MSYNKTVIDYFKYKLIIVSEDLEMSVAFSEKHIEAKLSQIGAKVVKATEMIFSAKKLCEDSNKILMDAQTEIADLYESLGDVLKTPSIEKDKTAQQK